MVEQLNNSDEPSKVLVMSNTGDISVIAHSADISQDFDDRRNLFGDLGSKYEAKRAENSILEASLIMEEPPLLLSKKESFEPESLSQISFLKKQLEEHESRLK